MRDPAEKLVEDKAIEQEENIDFKKNDKQSRSYYKGVTSIK